MNLKKLYVNIAEMDLQIILVFRGIMIKKYHVSRKKLRD